MRKLEELIEKLCPNGVEYKRLSDVCEFNRGTSITSKNANIGNVPVISGGQKPAFYHNTSNRPANTITIAGSGAYAGFISFWNEPIFCADAFSVDIKNKNMLNKRFLYHYLLNNQQEIYNKKTGAGIAHVYGKDIAKFYIPIPPLEIQNEIVYILDNFTELSENLLTELEARQKQYEYYKKKLEELIKSEQVEYKKFYDIAVYIRGVSYNKSKEINNGKDGYKLLRANNITLKLNTLNFNEIKTIDFSVNVKENQILKKNDILICAGSGSKEHIGKVAFINDDIKYTFGGFMGVIRTNEHIINSRYMFHIMTSSIFREHLFKVSNSSTINNINNNTWKDFEIPVPSLEVQKEIVSILDNFTLLSLEISKELESRQKQYEYYRERLLKFKDKNSEAVT